MSDLCAFPHQVAQRDDLIDQPQPQGLVCPDAVAGVQQLERAPYRNQPGQSLRPSSRWQPPEPGVAQAKLRVLSRDADVTAKSLLQTPAIGMAIDRGDERFGEVGQEGKREILRLFTEPCEIVGFQISADTKRPVSRTGENANAQRGIITKLAPDFGEHPVRFAITGIELLWTVDRHVRKRAFFFEQ